MSLKAFHILFIVVSILLALGFGAWEARAYLHGGGALDLVFCVLSFAGGVGLVFYLKAVLRKLKNIDYL